MQTPFRETRYGGSTYDTETHSAMRGPRESPSKAPRRFRIPCRYGIPSGYRQGVNYARIMRRSLLTYESVSRYLLRLLSTVMDAVKREPWEGRGTVTRDSSESIERAYWRRCVTSTRKKRDEISASYTLRLRTVFNVKLRGPMKYEEVYLRALKQISERSISIPIPDIGYWVNVFEASVSPTCRNRSRFISCKWIFRRHDEKSAR